MKRQNPGQYYAFFFALVSVLTLWIVSCGAPEIIQTDYQTIKRQEGSVVIKTLIMPELEVLTWEISIHGQDLKEPHIISVNNNNFQLPFRIFPLPVGENRTVSIKGFDKDNRLVLEGLLEHVNISSAPDSNIDMIIHPVYQAGANDLEGSLSINLSLNQPPVLKQLLINPGKISVGDHISFEALAIDSDNDPIHFEWTATKLIFSPQNEASVTAQAIDSGEDVVSLVLSDGSQQITYKIPLQIQKQSAPEIPSESQSPETDGGTPQGIYIAEFLADPPSYELTGDANRDGVRHTAQDEFIRIVNGSDHDIDLKDWSIGDGTSERHRFKESFILSPGNSLVIFGGGTIDGFHEIAAITASAGTLSLNNSNDLIFLKDAGQILVDQINYGNAGNGQSLILINGVFVPFTEQRDPSDPRLYSIQKS